MTGSRSDFDMVVTSESLGSLVNALDLSSVLVGGPDHGALQCLVAGPAGGFQPRAGSTAR